MTSIVLPGTLDNDDKNSISPNDGDQSHHVNFWKNRITSTKKLRVYDEFKKNRDEAKSFYRGDQITDTERSAWEGDTVQANLFRRLVNFLSDSIYNQSPAIRVMPRAKLIDNPQSPHYTSILEDHLNYIWDECNLGFEVLRTFKDSYFCNLAAAKIDYDKEKGLWRGKWVAGDLVCDPNAQGDLSRARWLAERVVMPRYRIWQDTTFDAEARKEIKERSSMTEDQSFSDFPGQPESSKDLETLWYIYTKEDIDPLDENDIINQGSHNKLLIICEDYDKFLLIVNDPTPYLANDDFPYAILRLDELPGEFIGPALWRQVEGCVRAFNWAASYHMTDMRKTASRPIGFDMSKIDDPEILKSRKHMVPIPVQGSPRDAVVPLDIGSADKTIFQSVEFFRNLLDKLTGIDDIAKGEEGKVKTATESQILQQNSSITLKGPQRAIDMFMSDLVRKIGLATLYYTPQFSISVGPNNILMTKQIQQIPVPGPMGIPQMDPNGQPMTVPQVIPVPAQLSPEQAQLYGATLQQAEPNSMMPPQAIYNGPASQGSTHFLVKGIDYFHGDQAAMMWPTLSFDDIKTDLDFSIEAGSSRAERRNEKQKMATALLQTVGADFQKFGLWDNYWELLNVYITAFDLANMDRIMPDKQKFMQAVQMMQQQMMMQQAPGGAPGGAPGAPDKANPAAFNKNAETQGKSHPLSPQGQGPQ